MQRAVSRLSAEPYDVLIVGGGINGAATAWDASLRGLRTAMIDQKDFGGATSCATLKLVHGGLRYLQHLDLPRMRQSIRERSLLLKLAPHLVSPLPFLVPTHGLGGLDGKAAMSAAILLNDVISFDRNHGIADPSRNIPSGRAWLSKRECIRKIRGLEALPIDGGVLFYDAQMYNSERLSLSFVLSAAEQGADCANYVRADRLVREGRRILGAEVTDTTTGDAFTIKAEAVINMTGPWSDLLLNTIDHPAAERDVLRSKGIQIVAPALTGQTALAIMGAERDPDAVFARGGRHYFITPWRGQSLIGTTDTVYRGDPDDFRITAEDIETFVRDINSAYPPAELTPGDVPFAFGGLRPITETNIEQGAAAARKFELNDHAKDELGVDNLISVVGVKYTTCRWLAEKTVNLLFHKLGYSNPPRTATDRTRLVGGEIDRIDDLMEQALKTYGPRHGATVIRHLVLNYGSRYRNLLEGDAAPEGGPSRLPDSAEVLDSEVIHAVRHEAAERLSDVVLRRTDLGSLGHPGRAALESCAFLMAAEKGWSNERTKRELADMEAAFTFH